MRNALFRNLWIATIVSNVGTWMQDVGAGWLMTSLSSSPSMVALVEAADSIPVMLLALPAGALADIIDRRRLLIGVQFYLLAVAGALALFTWLDLMTAWALLGFLFALGVGASLVMPAWAAIVPELVPASELSSAVALNSIAINVSRAIGPAIAGVLVAAIGPWFVFLLNALSYFGIIAVLLRWRREHQRECAAGRAFPERHPGRRTLHYAYARVAGRADSRHRLFRVRERDLVAVADHRAPRARSRSRRSTASCSRASASAPSPAPCCCRGCGTKFSRDAVVAGASVLYALAALGLAYVQNLGLLAVAMLAKGAAWIAILSALQVSAQFALPEWVRARGLAAFVVVLMGGMALGSILWGQVATAIGIPAALTTAALGMAAAVAATWRFKLGDHAVRDFTPSMDWPAPLLAETPEPDSGPVMVTIEYRIRPDKRAEFVAAMQEVREMRRRNGAFFWQLLHDSAAPTRYVEYFMDESWLEHLRQHERASVADRETLQRAKQFLVAGESSHTTHWLPDPPR